mmetsp:Transcript_10339/g.28825  ORF Transcript_10339/g.28825 Transcript_10339/m.28825 type:complete len:87 (+) Transcript_10339:1879-2139(+)
MADTILSNDGLVVPRRSDASASKAQASISTSASLGRRGSLNLSPPGDSNCWVTFVLEAPLTSVSFFYDQEPQGPKKDTDAATVLLR